MARRKIILIIISSVMFVGCAAPASNADMIQTAIAQTQVSQPYSTDTPATKTPFQIPTDTSPPQPTSTTSPTKTAKPTQAPTQTKNVEEVKEQFRQVIISILEDGEGLEDIDSVSVVRYGGPGILDIELATKWASRDRQPAVTYKIIQFLAEVLADDENDKELIMLIFGGNDLKINITTFSTQGSYRYQSLTDWATLELVKAKDISYDEWVSASGAGFK